MRVSVEPIKEDKGSSIHVELASPGGTSFNPRDDVTIDGDINVSADVLNAGDGYVATGEVKVTLNSECSRCLTGCSLPLTAKFVEEFRPAGGASQAEGKQADRADFGDYRVYSGDTLDLTETVRDAIIMATPIRILCDPECSGLCSICGTNLNRSKCSCEPPGDPRLSVLAKFFEGSSDKN